MAESRPIRATVRRRAAPPPGIPVEAFLQPFQPPIREVAVRLRELVRAELPDADERIRLHWKLLGYHLPLRRTGVFVAWVAPEPMHVHLGFPNGVLLEDPAGNLQGAGITKLARWLTYRSIDELDEGIAVRFLRAAAGAAELRCGRRA